MDEEENAMVINSVPIELHLKCAYCDKVCTRSWNASRTEWRRTCCPPRKQCTEGRDNNEVPSQIGGINKWGTVDGKRPIPRTLMTTDVQQHVPCKRQRGPPPATAPSEITQMVNGMRILNPGPDASKSSGSIPDNDDDPFSFWGQRQF